MSIKEYVTGMTLITALISCENPNQYTIKQQQKQIALYQDSIIKLNERIAQLEKERNYYYELWYEKSALKEADEYLKQTDIVDDVYKTLKDFKEDKTKTR
ncbi:MAG: hypothetical protein QW484_00955 [Candidatus Pacearchaeota archaeon]